MRSLATLAYWEAVVLLAGLLGVMLWKLLTGGISLDGLLEGDVRDPNSADGFRSQASAGRAQALTITLVVALWYLLQVIHNPREFPQVPRAMVAVLGGSYALYLVGKARALRKGR